MAQDNPTTSGDQLSGDALKTFVLDKLLISCAKLRAAGVVRTAVFGSVARGEAKPGSDVDILVELDPSAKIGLLKYVGLRQMFESILGRNVDLCTWNGLRHHARDSILGDAIDVAWPPPKNRNGICESSRFTDSTVRRLLRDFIINGTRGRATFSLAWTACYAEYRRKRDSKAAAGRASSSGRA